MAKSNRDRVGDIMDLLKAGLGPFVLRQYLSRYKGKYLREMELKLYNPPFSVSLPDEAAALDRVDVQGWLSLMAFNWKEAFADRLGKNAQNWTHELRTARNNWAHQKSFSNEETRRVAETAKLLLQAAGATDEAQAASRHNRELLRLLYERDALKAVKQPSAPASAPRTTDARLLPWRQIVEPHPDVREGKYMHAEFAADLGAVLNGDASPEYSDAGEFFRRTYMTEGLRDLIANGVKRLTGAGGDPVVQLQTNFGGGKTHSMLALYHAFGPGFKLSQLRETDEIRELAGDIDDDLTAQRAVIVGTSFNVSVPKQHKECSARTIWGEIAYQLGGIAGYEMVERNDLEGTNPGADTLVALLENHGPALIILDELVRLTQQLYGVAQVPAAGSFEAALAFMQSLTEAVKRSSDSLLLVAIPASEIEIGGEGGYTTLEKLRQTLGRLEAVWKPVSAEESYEIVRRRLFSDVPLERYADRDAVVNAFHALYANRRADFPGDAAEEPYRRKMRQAYPIHPELFDRLYEDWSTLERFQRTRGVLRMMASVIHRLWMENDQSLMIMPGSIPLGDKSVESEITNYLQPKNFSPVIGTDIDGVGSKPYQIDSDVKQLGKFEASRRVARAIFMGSAPTVSEQGIRGLDARRVNLGTVQPGETPGPFGDALRRMSSQLTYLYNDGSRYWYDTRPTVNRTAQERAQNLEEYQVLTEAGKRLKALGWKKCKLGSVHIMPESSAEIPDERSARAVVLSPEHCHVRGDEGSAAMQFIREVMSSRGKAPRHHRNMLVFIAPDEARNRDLDAGVRALLAWRSIERDKRSLNLDYQQSQQVEEAIRRWEETVEKRLQETYCWLIAPQQPERQGELLYAPERIRVSGNFLEGAARRLDSANLLIYRISPDYLLEEMGDLIWQDGPHRSVAELWDWLTKYCYLPRLFDQDVLEQCISAGVNRTDPAFGYATRFNDKGGYDGLKWGELPTLYFDGRDVIVKPELALALRRQQAVERAAIEGIAPPPVISDEKEKDNGVAPPEPPPPKPKTRYYGRAAIDAGRPIPAFQAIADEIIQHLTALPEADVQITLEINGELRGGFDDGTMRAISENSRTLRFQTHSFED